MLENKQATPDENGVYLATLRVPALIDLDTMAIALAIEHGAPPRYDAKSGSWTGRVGMRRAQRAVIALAQRRIAASRDGDSEPEIPAAVLDGWRRYIVDQLGAFPPEALPS